MSKKNPIDPNIFATSTGQFPTGGHGLKWNSQYYWDSASYNQQLYQMFRGECISLALTRYKWINLPETCNERFLELTLLTQGLATIAHPIDKPDEWRSLQCIWQGSDKSAYDMYGNPIAWKAFGINGAEFGATKATGYYIWDNKGRATIMDRIELWCRELVDIIRTSQQNRTHQKLPVIVTGPQEKDFDRLNMVKQIQGGELFIIGNNSLDSSFKVETLDTQVPYIGDDLMSTFMNVWNQIYSALGIKNLPFKAERRIEDEVQSQVDPSNLIALDGLSERRAACRYLNTHFDTFREKPLEVVWREDNESENYNIAHNVKDYVKLLGGDSDAGDE